MSMIKKIYVVLIVLIVLVLVRLVFISNKQNSSGDSAIVAPPKDPERTESCTGTIVSAYLKNRNEIRHENVESRQFMWNGNKYNLIVFECPDSDKYIYPRVLALTKMNKANTEEIELFSMADEMFNLDDSKIVDINEDGLAELVVSHSNGGNCPLCGGFSLFQIAGDKVNDLLSDFPKSEGGQYATVWLSDLNNDNISDILVSDDSFALAHSFLHYTAPIKTYIYSWKDGAYQDMSEDFTSFYSEQINTRNRNYQKLMTVKSTELDVVAGRVQQISQIAIENYFDYSTMGKPDLGYDTFVRQMDLSNLTKDIKLSDSDLAFIKEINEDIAKDYQDLKPTKMLLY